MKKMLFLLFVICFIPTVSFAVCQNQQSGDFEFSECMFQGKNYSNAVKNFWGNPKINASETLSSNGSAGDFVLRRAWQCGKCDSNSWQNKADTDIYENCNNSKDYKSPDDEMILVYVATDVSEHGAEFCLTQFTSASWRHPQFFIYHQIPRTSKLQCAWFCEPGWDGDRCETKGLPAGRNTWGQLKSAWDEIKLNYTGENLAKNLFAKSECANCSSAAYRTAVLDYKKTGKQVQPWGGEGASYQQEIVIGATGLIGDTNNGFHGIKARPILIGAGGGHTACFSANTEKDNWSSGDYPYDVNQRKFLEHETRMFAKPVSGGKERVLCLQGYTLNENCDKSYTSGSGALTECTTQWYGVDFSALSNRFDEKKHYKKYYAAGGCLIYQCLNGMNFSSDDNYACSVCNDSPGGIQGLCLSTNNCKWCGAGKCLNKTTCKCEECSAVLTMEQMRLGPNKLDQCWEIIDADEFRACVTGLTSGDGQSSAD